jgi:hypothetical protein
LESAKSGFVGMKGTNLALQKDQLNSAFTTSQVLEDLSIDVHVTALQNKQSHFIVYDNAPEEVVQQMLNIAHTSGRSNYVQVVPCKWKGKECMTNGGAESFRMESFRITLFHKIGIFQNGIFQNGILQNGIFLKESFRKYF